MFAIASPGRLFTVFLALSAGAHAQWLNFKTPGTPRTPDGKPDLAAPAPRALDGKPDLSGVWMHELTSVAEMKRLYGQRIEVRDGALVNSAGSLDGAHARTGRLGGPSNPSNDFGIFSPPVAGKAALSPSRLNCNLSFRQSNSARFHAQRRARQKILRARDRFGKSSANPGRVLPGALAPRGAARGTAGKSAKIEILAAIAGESAH